MEQALQAVLFQAQQKNISIQKNIQLQLSSVQADPEKTSWVLINFLTNAVKYSPESSAIDISVTQKENKISFAVADHGKGIEEKYLPKLFERYFKVPGTYDRSGTGLGLAISKEFIEAQGGIINVQSVLNEGSTFSFTLTAA